MKASSETSVWPILKENCASNTDTVPILWWTTDHSKGFGGKYGVQADRVDQSAVGWDHKESVEKHESQKGEIVWFFCLSNSINEW